MKTDWRWARICVAAESKATRAVVRLARSMKTVFERVTVRGELDRREQDVGVTGRIAPEGFRWGEKMRITD